MKIKSVTVTYEIQGKDQEEAIKALFALPGSHKDRPSNERVKAEGPVAYTPSCDRTKGALEALGKCRRVRLLRPEALEAWATAYPSIDLAAEIAKAEAWAEGKGVTRSPRGWQKAINFWFSRAQDNTRGNANVQAVVLNHAKPHTPEAEADAWAKADGGAA